MTSSTRIADSAAPSGWLARLRTVARRVLLALAGALRPRRQRAERRPDNDPGQPIPAAWPKATDDWRDAA